MNHRSTIERVASVGTISVSGTFYRHAAAGRDPFAGGSGGRWGATFPVIYLGRPESSVIVEAYRHLVEETGVPAQFVKPRTLYVVEEEATRILDLTSTAALEMVGLTDDDLMSDVDEYNACQAVAAAAHQLKCHGILAPAATGLGSTLALFRERLPNKELPVVTAQDVWERLPADPRRLRRADEG
jgi:RES domain-containing protein